MSSLGMMVGAWSMLVSIVAPTPREIAPAPSVASQEGQHAAQSQNTSNPSYNATDALVTAYTCQPVAANPMTPCNTTRWGSDPFTSGAACPESWAYRRVLVAGVWYTCDDTPYHDFINGLPHIDLRLPTLTAAVQWGIREIEIGVQP